MERGEDAAGDEVVPAAGAGPRENAAREDQATDRVYRIGQRCAVQVFKLVVEDDPKPAKIFSREELLAMLRSTSPLGV